MRGGEERRSPLNAAPWPLFWPPAGEEGRQGAQGRAGGPVQDSSCGRQSRAGAARASTCMPPPPPLPPSFLICPVSAGAPPFPPPVLVQVGNFRVEPPGLFRGRGEHPKMGRLKVRVYPSDITINIGEGATVPPVPEMYKGQKWKLVKSDNTVTWLAYWKVRAAMRCCLLGPLAYPLPLPHLPRPLLPLPRHQMSLLRPLTCRLPLLWRRQRRTPVNQSSYKYVWLAANSGFKTDADLQK